MFSPLTPLMLLSEQVFNKRTVFLLGYKWGSFVFFKSYVCYLFCCPLKTP